MTDVRLKKSPPWITYVNQLSVLFGEDPEITIEYNNDIYRVELFVDNEDKAEALSRLLPVEKVFGNVILSIAIIPTNITFDSEENNATDFDAIALSYKDLFDTAFNNNPVYCESVTMSSVFISNAITYVVFKNKVVQFFNDNLNDLHGNISTLYQEIASDLFRDTDLMGVYYCTEVEGDVGKPLGEWP